MFYKIVTMYGNMEDPESFYHFYRNTMVPKILSLEGVLKINVNRLFYETLGKEEPSDSYKPKYHVMGELYVTDVHLFMESFRNSDAGQIVASFLTKDAIDYASFYTAFEETFEK
ncbi:EthD family reductase [Shimazuella sp. AN120528]|uniref:EthD family reductase n=1 Tax=Shimazuella soli TaxID=1892854 RepID=UPI001F0D7552|nr:EthD family reductase [Shimazuella soli]MCH5583711.1 EthD family reductase [Shimazuella soli]